MSNCFLIMPYRAQYEPVCTTIRNVAKNYNINVTRADENFFSAPLMEKIIDAISSSDYIIAILGDNQNANVFYELGVAHSKKPYSKVLIFKDESEEYLFDIQHIKQFSFNCNDQQIIEKVTTNFFQTNTNENSLENALLRLQKLKEDQPMYTVLIDHLKTNLDIFCNEIAYILTQSHYDTINVSRIKLVSNNIYQEFLNNLNSTNSTLVSGLLYLYLEIITRTHEIIDYQVEVNKFLSNNEISDEHKAIFTAFLVDNKLFMEKCIEWQISYFGVRDMHRVDVNRYRIEYYLLRSNSPAVSKALVGAISNSNAHIREYCAEIIRAKKLNIATDSLLNQLQYEDNPYTARSIVDALVELEKNNFINHGKCFKSIKEFETRYFSAHPDAESNIFLKKHLDVALTVFTPKPAA